MIVSVIAAMSENRVVGKDNTLPWHLSADLKRFKHLTMGHVIIMGRKTFDSIGKPLKGRKNVVISRNAKELSQKHRDDSLYFFESLQQAISVFQAEDEIFVIGGAQIWQQAMKVVDRIYLTLIHWPFQGDTYFPEFEKDFQKISESLHTEGNLSFSFINYDRKKST